MENSLSTLQPYQLRVVREKADLDELREALRGFITRDPRFYSLDEAEQNRMRRQHVAMVEYSNVLGERIAAFSSKSEPWALS